MGIWVAKMTTRYPDFHGTGYYNFLMDADEEWLHQRIESNSHDFALEKVVQTRFKTVKALMKKYPTKGDLNERYFKNV